MEEKGGAAVGGTVRRHIHIGHAQPLAVLGEREHADRIGVGEAFESDAEGLLGAGTLCSPFLGTWRARGRHSEEKGEANGSFQGSQCHLSNDALAGWRRPSSRL